MTGPVTVGRTTELVTERPPSRRYRRNVPRPFPGRGVLSTFGYEDGERIPLDLHLGMVGRIARAVDLPVTMDFEAGYGDAGETAHRAIAAGVVRGSREDQLKPLDEAVAAVEAVLAAGRAELEPV